jgi:hypothetical protein
MNEAYILSLPTGIIRHFPGHTATVRDYASRENPRLDAAVRSRDYFITLATTLEAIGLELSRDNPAAAQAIDATVADLEYLQQHYAIVRKSQAHQAEN